MHPRRAHIHTSATFGQRAADRTAQAIGSWRFLGIQSGVLFCWIVFNSIALVHHFDPFPYILCNLALSFQAAFTGPVLLIAANRSAQRDRLRDDTEAQEVEQITGLVTEIHTLTLGQNAILDILRQHIAGDTATLTAPEPLMEAIPLPPARPDGSLYFRGPHAEFPDKRATPGAINPDVTDATIPQTIGVSGWTATIRPPVSFTNALKMQQMAEYGLAGDPSDYEEDHLIPLECGGAPHDAANLWPQRRAGVWGARTKDLTENAAKAAILSGAMTLADVQEGFRTDWTALHTKLLANVTPAMAVHLMMMQPPEDEP